MKNFLLLLAFVLLCTHPAKANLDTLKPKSSISEVTVFFSGAQVTRKASLNLQKGKYALVFEGLPAELNPESINVSLGENASILSVKDDRYYPGTKNNEKLKTIEAKIEAKEIKLNIIQNKAQSFQVEKEILLKNSKLGNEQSALNVSQIQAAADFYRKRWNEIEQAELDLAIEAQNTKEEIKELFEEYNQQSVEKNKNFTRLIINIECKSNYNTPVLFSYFTELAGWTPNYDFRVNDLNKPMIMLYKADVYQSSGEDWNKAKLSLSAENPLQNRNAPELKPWYLPNAGQGPSDNAPQASGAISGRVTDSETKEAIPFAKVAIYQGNNLVGKTSSDLNGQYTIKPLRPGNYIAHFSFISYYDLSRNINIPSGQTSNTNISLKRQDLRSKKEEHLPEAKARTVTVRSDIANMAVRDVTSVASQSAGVTSNSLFDDFDRYTNKKVEINLNASATKNNISNLVYEISSPYTILSDGEDYSINIKKVHVPARYVYHSVPKIDPKAYLTAEILNWGELSLLSGSANIYFEGTYVGNSLLNTQEVSDTLEISLGHDKGITISRELNTKMSNKQVFSGNIKEHQAWDITVKNNKAQNISLYIHDQLPLSQQDHIDVYDMEYPNAKLNKKTGELTWNLNLEEGASTDLSFQYWIKYPRTVRVYTR